MRSQCATACFASISLFLLEPSLCSAQSRVQWNEEAAQRIEAELEKPFEGEFLQTPIEDVALYLGEVYDLTVVVNDSYYSYTGTAIDYTPSSPVSLGEALTRMLEPALMDWTIDGGSLYIASYDTINTRQYIRVYDVSQFVTETKSDEQALREFITDFVDPSDWDANYGYGSIRSYDGLLIVLQDYHTHRRLEDFIEQMQAAHQASADVVAVDANMPQPVSDAEPTAVAYRVYAPASLVGDIVDGTVQPSTSYDYGQAYDPYGIGAAVDGATGSANRGEDFSTELVEIVPRLVAPGAWSEDGECTIEAIPGYVIVRAPEDVHAQVREFLHPFMEHDTTSPFGDPDPGYDYSASGTGIY